jgi:hypothetical protein
VVEGGRREVWWVGGAPALGRSTGQVGVVPAASRRPVVTFLALAYWLPRFARVFRRELIEENHESSKRFFVCLVVVGAGSCHLPWIGARQRQGARRGTAPGRVGSVGRASAPCAQ